jgi:limonene-1,2-epoxide hydrolase
MDDNERLVREFWAAWGRADAAELAGYFAEDGVYHNIPSEPLRGREAIRTAIAGWLTRMADFRVEFRNVVSAGDVVMTERVDHWVTNGRATALPVVGVFELEGGKIRALREYFNRSA